MYPGDGVGLHRLLVGPPRPLRVLFYAALLVALTIVDFATLYNWQRHAFTGMRTRVAPLYFSITTFSTTGYGDIHPTKAAGQLLSSGQMLIDWIESAVVGALVLSALIDALGARRSAQKAAP